MVRALLLAVCLLPLSLWAQDFPIDRASGKIIYTEEVPVKDGPKTDLYNRARAWWLTAHKGSQTLQVDDPANGLLMGNTFSLIVVWEKSQRHTYKLWHTIKIEVEDDRFWYRISDIQLQRTASKGVLTPKEALESFVLPGTAAGKKGYPNPGHPALMVQVHKGITALIEDMKKNMF
jgi:hypothetical protein